jgi:polar amino acid transport system substrate-binding protein
VRARRTLAWAALGGLAAARALAQTAAPLGNRELAVGVFEAPPYAMKGPSGEWKGFAVDLWKVIAGDLGLPYRFEEGTEERVLEGVADRRLDLAVGPFAATMDRERIVDFSHTYLSAGLVVAVRPRSRMDRLLAMFRSLVDSEAAHLIAAIALLSVLFGLAIWLAERRKNPQFSADPAAGIGSGAWWAGVTTTGVGYGDKVPITLRGRLVAVLWMLVSLVLFVMLTAGLTATLAVAEFQRGRPQDLRRSVVGALDGSAAADFLRRNHVPYRLYPTFRGVLDSLAAKKVDAVMAGEAILRHYAARGVAVELEVLPQTFMSEALAFPLPDGSPLRDPIDSALRRALDGPPYRDLKDRYLGDVGRNGAAP